MHIWRHHQACHHDLTQYGYWLMVTFFQQSERWRSGYTYLRSGYSWWWAARPPPPIHAQADATTPFEAGKVSARVGESRDWAMWGTRGGSTVLFGVDRLMSIYRNRKEMVCQSSRFFWENKHNVAMYITCMTLRDQCTWYAWLLRAQRPNAHDSHITNFAYPTYVHIYVGLLYVIT